MEEQPERTGLLQDRRNPECPRPGILFTVSTTETRSSPAPPQLPCYQRPRNTITTTRVCDGRPHHPTCSPSPKAGLVCCPLQWAEKELPHVPLITSPTVYGKPNQLCHRPGKGPVCFKQNYWRGLCCRMGKYEG